MLLVEKRLFTDSGGSVFGVCVQKLDYGNANFAEFSAVLIVVEQAAIKG